MLDNKVTKPVLPPRRQLRFVFNEACRDALRDYPQLGPNTTFVMGVEKKGRTDYVETVALPEAAKSSLASRDWIDTLRCWLRSIHTDKISYALLPPQGQERRAIIFTPHSQLRAVYPHAAAMLFFEFDHELGHLVTRHGAYNSKGAIYAENSADAYAALRAIQRFGKTPPHLNAMSQARAEHMLTMNTRKHVTTQTLDAIIIDSAHIDFTKLTPDETVAAANEYARRFSPSPQDVAVALHDLSGLQNFKRNPQQLLRLGQIASSTQNRFVFTIAARALMAALTAGPITGVSREMRLHLALKLQQRALELGQVNTLRLLRADAAKIGQLPSVARERKACAAVRYKRA